MRTLLRGQRQATVRMVALVAVAASALGFATPASASPAPVLWSFSAAKATPGNAASLLIAGRDRYCPPGTPIASSLTLPKALANARATVVALAGASAVAAFDRSSTADSSIQSRAAATAMFADRKPVPALLALLRDHQLQPKDPSILSSISALLNILGRPSESLAIARAADAMAAAPAQAMGISGQAMLLNNEGHAMLGLRRWTDAEKVLRQAVILAPELAEAKVNLAIALLCQHEDREAVKFFRLGQYRKAYPMVSQGDSPDSGTAPAINRAFDLSQGVDGTFPALRIPPAWTQNNGAPAEASWKALDDEWLARLQRFIALEQEVRSGIDWQHMPPWVSSRYSQVLIAAGTARRQPQVKPLYDAYVSDQRALDAFIEDYYHLEAGNLAGKLGELMNARSDWPECTSGTPEACEGRWQQECSSLNAGQHSLWLPLMQRYDHDIRAFYRVDYRYGTALAANIADPKLHDLAVIQIKKPWNEYHYEIGNLWRWATYLRFSHCNSSPPTEGPKIDDGRQPGSAACPQFLKGVKFGVRLGDLVKVSVNCEQIGVEVASKSDVLWIGFFGEGSFNFVQGTGTVFAGLKAGGKIPETGVSVSAKEGLYLTIGSSGIRDVGMRVSTSGSYGLAGGPTVDMKGPGYQVSWVSQTITFQ